MTIKEAIEEIEIITDYLQDYQHCSKETEALKLAIKCMGYFHGLRNNLDVAYTLANRHYQHNVMDEIKNFLDEVGFIK